MTDILDRKFGSSTERKLFVKKHSEFFKNFQKLEQALQKAFPKVNSNLSKQDMWLFTLCKTCVGDFDEIVLLCGNGLGNGALILLGRMFENLVFARYLHLYPNQVERIGDFNTTNFYKLNHDDFTKKIKIEIKLDISGVEASTKHFSDSKSNLDFVKLAEIVGLRDDIKNAYNLSLECTYWLVTSRYLILNATDNKLESREDELQKKALEIAFPTAYNLVSEVLLLLIEHFNLNRNDFAFKEWLNDYDNVLKGKPRLNQSSVEVSKVKSRKRDSEADYKAKSKRLLDGFPINSNVEKAVGISLKDLTDLFLLESIKGFGPQKFKELHRFNVHPSQVLDNPAQLPIGGKRGDDFRSELKNLMNNRYEECHYRAIYQIISAYKYKAVILTYDHPAYPHNAYESNNPIPILYVRGSLRILKERNAVACVGSRNIRSPYSNLHAQFAKEAISMNFNVVSGFALGADRIGHETAFKSGGSTICVMPSGLEKPFPPENKDLWDELLSYNHAAFITEFPFGIRAASLTLRKRNKLIVALSKGVLIGQSSVNGGAMNAYRFAREQHKPVATFAPDGTEETSGNKKISEERELIDAIFSTKADLPAYMQWLQKLYSST